MSRLQVSRRGFGVMAGAALVAGARGAQGQPALPPLAGTAESPMGPFYPVSHLAEDDADLVWLKGHSQRALGEVIEVSGRVLDRHGKPMADATLEVWQANAAGRYAHPNEMSKAPLDPNFQGFATLKTGKDGDWRITTIKPAAYDSPIGLRTPHIHFDVRGTGHRLTAQMYFPEDAALNARDQLYKGLGGEAGTSVAAGAGAGKYRWDIVLMDG
ncbi:protocatechuate 3,4-dioxygenase [Phenylobacterium sp.]|uniref:protocatechuate 3,4-dioxygenase n=1 Tax=Phenylobacterium sp. TaxID=1871053 RepID=UPI00286A9885|nr:protocatechuate 3,4-dioxygenase [Phenylobacterium sp.]